MLFTLRYRRGSTGVITSFIEASSQEKAEAVGQQFCDDQVNCRFIQVQPAIVADESILSKPEAEPAQKLKKSA